MNIMIGFVIILIVIFLSSFIVERIDEIKHKNSKYYYIPNGVYGRYLKRPFDCLISCFSLLILSPLMLFLTILGFIKMKGNPFFTQVRPGRINPNTGEESLFKLIKFRSMTNEKDENGNLLPDEIRLSKYGKILRASSADELGELINVIKGEMSLIGPRPWAVSYLKYFTPEEHERHLVRPGLTGLAQVNGRTTADWSERLKYDLDYVKHISFINDVKIIFLTIKKVLVKSDIVEAGSQGDFDAYRRKQWADGTVTKPNDFMDD